MNFPIQHAKAHSNTGLSGVHRTSIRGRDCLSVSWRPSKGVRKATTIYFGHPSDHDYESALFAARCLRQAKLEARLNEHRKIINATWESFR